MLRVTTGVLLGLFCLFTGGDVSIDTHYANRLITLFHQGDFGINVDWCTVLMMVNNLAFPIAVGTEFCHHIFT